VFASYTSLPFLDELVGAKLQAGLGCLSAALKCKNEDTTSLSALPQLCLPRDRTVEVLRQHDIAVPADRKIEVETMKRHSKRIGYLASRRQFSMAHMVF